MVNGAGSRAPSATAALWGALVTRAFGSCRRLARPARRFRWGW